MNKNIKPISFFKIPKKFDSYFLTKKDTNQYIKELAQDIKNGAKMPPIKINKAGEILDGEHRLRAFKLAGIKDIPIKLVKEENKHLYDDELWLQAILGEI